MFYWRPFGSDESCQRDAHSWPEKLTSWQAPRPNCAHQLAAFASASACGAILRFEEQEPSAVKPIASHGRSVEAAFGWLDSGPGMGAGLGVTSSIFGGAGIGGGAGRPGAGSGTGDPVDVRAMTKASSGWDNVSEASACRAGEAAIREVVIATADDGAMGRTARIVQVNSRQLPACRRYRVTAMSQESGHITRAGSQSSLGFSVRRSGLGSKLFDGIKGCGARIAIDCLCLCVGSPNP